TWTYTSFTALARANANTTAQRSAFIFSSQSLGLALLNAKVTYSTVIPAVTANATFEIIQATSPPTPPGPSVSGGGGGAAGGGGGGIVLEREADAYQLLITQVPQDIKIVRGWTDFHSVQVTNNGTATLEDIQLLLTGIPTPWFTISPAAIERLGPGASGTFVIDFAVPADADAKTYDLTLAALTSKARDSRSIPFTVFTSQYDLLAAEITSLKESLRALEQDASQAEQIGKEVSQVWILIEQIRTHLASAESALQESRFDTTTEQAVTAHNLLRTARALLAAAEFKYKLEAQVTPLWQIALAIGILAAVNAVLFVYVKRGRKLPLSRPKLARKKEGPDWRVEQEMVLQEKDKVSRMLRLLESEVKDGTITPAAYQELKKSSEERLHALDKKLKGG
ncbi:MAG: hypothetical protein HY520_03105, partial [Candidatus Aenigmarchaeota archaeon]|nr:hypothetical protein [Candidatus Aenigmarchaeota archaeon]